MDQELLAFVDQRLTEAREHAQGLTVETRRHTEALAVETRRHFDVVAESLRSDIRLVAEGHTALAQRPDKHRREPDAAHREVLSAVKFSYAELDRRITRPEAVSADLEGRLARLEARR